MLDHILAILLLIVVPMRALWRSRPGRPASSTKITRYISTIGMVTGLLALLATSWLITGRSAEALGLAAPTSTPSLIGLGIAVVIFITLFLGRNKKPKPSQKEGIEAAQRDLFPETPKETRLFLFLCLAVGGGWEILYRGFLLYYLPSMIGLFWAVIIAAVAYGAAHGFKNPKQFVGSIVSALVFTVAYVATSNLWWLMLIHIGVMLIGAAASKAISSNSEPAD
ncbi:type II CAAX endopeptidase family protein [Sphingomonas sp. 2R-10]|uniref:CPBP family intramembrane glutamic endopeptidase n=1 Tax=Sphingomonas sp. 2R-10 TaxID=3045148 RepID=UPI0024BBBBE9|nr:type II CAAX endopeptidase family protein [Sphingomonas sp. 2R-10]MDJ0276058.1 type II CAAX endopeptidase family protein [Sphingomonas sp. 2R-10]